MLVTTIVTASCAGTPSTSGDYPPELPPVETIQMNFIQVKDDSLLTSVGSDTSVNHFSRATNLLAQWSETVTSYLKLPEAFLRSARNIQPELNKSNKWEWKYSASVNGTEYPLRLVASRKEKNKVKWELYISNAQLGLEDQLFFSGSSTTEGSRGAWTIFQRNGESINELATLKWDIQGEDHVKKKLVVKSNLDKNRGNTIEYTFDGTRKTVIYHNVQANKTVEVQRNLESNIGYIFSPNYNKGQQACWSSHYQDVLCSEV